MHGAIFVALRQFASTDWDLAARAAGFGGKPFLPLASYPADELTRIVAALAERRSQTADELLEQFGAHLAPELLNYPGVRIPPSWRSLEVIENAESIIHSMVRRVDPIARPPRLVIRRLGREELEVRYRSPLRLCALAKGIVRGIGRAHGDRLHLHERACMLLGADACVLAIRRVGSTEEFIAISDTERPPPEKKP